MVGLVDESQQFAFRGNFGLAGKKTLDLGSTAAEMMVELILKCMAEAGALQKH